MIIRPQDGLEIGLCLRKGQKEFCRQHGIDFRRFCREGIPVEELTHIEDANLQKVIAHVRRRDADGG